MSGRAWSDLVGSGRNPTTGLLKSSGQIWSDLVGSGRWRCLLLTKSKQKSDQEPQRFTRGTHENHQDHAEGQVWVSALHHSLETPSASDIPDPIILMPESPGC